jgi:Nucleotidyltransferase of unknown function (DUF6036)
VPHAAVADVLAVLARALRAHRRRWYVFGAQAVLAYGRPRLTRDVDVLVDPGRARAPRIASELVAADMTLRFAVSHEHLRTARLLPLVHRPSGTPVDVVPASGGLQREFLARARLLDLGGVRVPVVAPEDLVAQKLLAGRRKDLEDVRGILARQGGRLDAAVVRAVLVEVQRVSCDPLPLRRFERFVGRATSSG